MLLLAGVDQPDGFFLIEALGLEYPMRVERYEVRYGTGGDGEHRGGDGIVRSVRILEPASLSMLTDRRRHGSRSIAGGEPVPVALDQRSGRIAIFCQRIGAGAAWFMSKADERFGVSELYQSLYGVGIVLLAYSIATALGGDGFLASTLARDFYHRSIAMMRGASTIDTFVSLNEEESYAVEYWPLELYKLALKPPPKELEGRVALVTGGAGGIGSSVAQALDEQGACVVPRGGEGNLKEYSRRILLRCQGAFIGICWPDLDRLVGACNGYLRADGRRLLSYPARRSRPRRAADQGHRDHRPRTALRCRAQVQEWRMAYPLLR